MFEKLKLSRYGIRKFNLMDMLTYFNYRKATLLMLLMNVIYGDIKKKMKKNFREAPLNRIYF